MKAVLVLITLVGCTALANQPPELMEIPDMETREGVPFRSIRVEDVVTDPDHAVDDLVWTLSGHERLTASVAAERIFVGSPDTEWWGSETIRIEVCDPAGACAAQDVVSTVHPVNDAPTLTVPDQIAPSGTPFEEIVPSDLVSDIDHGTEEMTWAVSGNVELAVVIEDGVATIAPPQADWAGAEMITVEVCDPLGVCASSGALIARTDAASPLITLIGNAGFVVSCSDTSAAIDALHAFQIPSGLGAAICSTWRSDSRSESV